MQTTCDSNDKKIAIVEDDPDMKHLYLQILRRQGYSVPFASITGEEIVNVVAKEKTRDSFDLVIIDYSLPGSMNGLEAAKEIASLSPRTQILMITGEASIEREARRAGFGFLSKPFEISKLLTCIDSRLKNNLDLQSESLTAN